MLNLKLQRKFYESAEVFYSEKSLKIFKPYKYTKGISEDLERNKLATSDLSGNPKQGTPCVGPELSSVEPYLGNTQGLVGKKVSQIFFPL